MNELLRELGALGLLSPGQARQVADSPNPCDDPAECARRLVEAGLLTALQARQVLAGKGRKLLVGPYVLLEEIGRGGMATVYRAEHRLMKRVVALKVASHKSSRHHRSTIRTRFRREVEATGRLHHPNIAAAYDAGQSRGRWYLAMEYVSGTDLERMVHNGGSLSVALACEVVRQAAEALRYIHERGLIHHDIKPSNLMLAAPGVSVKLLDLGLARRTDRSSGGDDEPCGTPDYLAPECANDPRRADSRSDLYSLGCTFYFLLTGQVPYPGGSWSEKLLRHHLDSPAPVRELRPEVPEDIARIVERMMARDPAQRCPTASAVLASLAAVGTGATTREHATTGSQSGEVAGRRASPRFFSVALAAMLSGLAAAGGARWFLHQPAEPARPSVETPAPSFRIESNPLSFATLEGAVAAARDGDTVTLPSSDPITTRPLDARGKALRLRSAPGVRPRVVMRASGGDPWQALLATDRPLRLEGLDLELIEDAAGRSRSLTGSLIRCAGAPLHLSDCRLKCAGGVAIIARNTDEVSLRDCRIDAGTVGLSVEIGQVESCRVRLTESRVTVRAESGAALSVWAPEVRRATRFELELSGNTFQAGRIAALRALPAGVSITAHGNRFTFAQALLSFTGYAGQDAWRDGTAWDGDDNVYEGPSARVLDEGQPVAPIMANPPR
jgi:serine/threonine-protein kinase